MTPSDFSLGATGRELPATSTVRTVVNDFSSGAVPRISGYHQFADDTQLLVTMSATNTTSVLAVLSRCPATVRLWFLRLWQQYTGWHPSVPGTPDAVSTERCSTANLQPEAL